MVSTPRNRHSGTGKDPVTLDLEAEPADSGVGAGAERSEEEKVEPGPPEDAKAATPRRVSSSALLVAGAIGGAVALAGAWGLHQAGWLLPSDRGTEEQIAALSGELTALRNELGGLRGSGDALSQRIEALESGLTTLQGDIASLQAGPDGGVPEELTARIEALERRQAVTQGSATGPGAGELSALQQDVEAAGQSASAALQKSEANAAALARLREDLAALSRRMDTESANPEVAIAIAAVALRSAVDSGEPFTLQLETYASVAPGSPELEALRELAATGVPSRAKIAAAAGEAANAIVRAAHRLPPDAGFLERMLASLRSLVKVRPVGMVEGDTPAAIAARMEVAIQENDFETAVREFESLPPQAQEAGADFIAQVRARLEADRLIDRALASVLRSAG